MNRSTLREAGAGSRANVRRAAWNEPASPSAEQERALQLEWLRSLPGYRELIRARLSQAAKDAELRTRRIERWQETLDEPDGLRRAPGVADEHRVEAGLRELLDRARPDVDRLGREVEGCG